MLAEICQKTEDIYLVKEKRKCGQDISICHIHLIGGEGGGQPEASSQILSH
jgi:hypothetical protein